MLQEYWASTVIFIGIFSQCMLLNINLVAFLSRGNKRDTTVKKINKILESILRLD